jgi:hypothetical protein
LNRSPSHPRWGGDRFKISTEQFGGEEVALGCLAKAYAQRDLLAAISAVEAVLDGRPPKRLPGGFRLLARPEAA